MPANRSVSSATFPVHLAAGGHPPLVTCSEIIRPTMTQGLAQHIHLNQRFGAGLAFSGTR